jgi:Ca2+-transporting ATPase
MQPTPDAQRHFGSSTSFRRHGGGVSNSQNATFESMRSAVIEEGPSGIWDRLVGLAKGVRYGSNPEENGYELALKVDQTPSAKYSSYDAEVRSSPLRYPNSSLQDGRRRSSSPSLEPPVPMA